MKKKRGKSFLKRYKFVIIIFLLLAILFVPFRNPFYKSYYKEACEEQEEENILQRWKDNQKSTQEYLDNESLSYEERQRAVNWKESSDKLLIEIESCINTGGCYFGGSSCPPRQRVNIISYFLQWFRVCNMLAVGQCVCPLGTEFDSEKGCI